VLPGGAVGGAREQRVAVDQVEQRHRLAAQAVDDVAVVDHLDAPPIARGAAARQGEHVALGEEAFQPVIIDAQAEPEADQARRHGVEHLFQHKAAAGGDLYDGLVVVGGAPRRQPPEYGPLKADQPVASGIASPDQVGEPAAIGREAVEVGAAAQHQGLGDGALEMAVLALNGAVLVRDAQVVAGRLHAVVAAQRLVAPGLILGGVAVEVAKGGGEAV